MSWLLPVPLLLFAGVVAPLPLAAPRLVMETFALTLAVIAVEWAGWLVLSLIEHRR
jgi:hypothetical protein